MTLFKGWLSDLQLRTCRGEQNHFGGVVYHGGNWEICYIQYIISQGNELRSSISRSICAMDDACMRCLEFVA